MHLAPDGAGDRRPHAQAQYVGKGCGGEIAPEIHGVAQALDWLPEEEALGYLVQPLRDLEELSIAFGAVIPRREPSELLLHGSDVFAQVERRAILEEAAPLRIEADEVELVLEPPAGFAKDAR